MQFEVTRASDRGKVAAEQPANGCVFVDGRWITEISSLDALMAWIAENSGNGEVIMSIPIDHCLPPMDIPELMIYDARAE
jgi:hypothetical protein